MVSSHFSLPLFNKAVPPFLSTENYFDFVKTRNILNLLIDIDNLWPALMCIWRTWYKLCWESSISWTYTEWHDADVMDMEYRQSRCKLLSLSVLCYHLIILVNGCVSSIKLWQHKNKWIDDGTAHTLWAECLFQGRRISLNKRAQILVADYWGVMGARGEVDFINMDWLTMFADYRVPQALVYLGALRYSDTLMLALKKGETRACVLVFHWFKKVHISYLLHVMFPRRASEFRWQKRSRDPRLFNLVCGADQRASL